MTRATKTPKLVITTVTKKVPVSPKRKELEKTLGEYYTKKLYTQYEYDCNYTNGYHRRDGEGRYLDVGSREFVIACHDHYKQGFDDGCTINDRKLDEIYQDGVTDGIDYYRTNNRKKGVFSMVEIVCIGLVFGSLLTLVAQMIYASI